MASFARRLIGTGSSGGWACAPAHASSSGRVRGSPHGRCPLSTAAAAAPQQAAGGGARRALDPADRQEVAAIVKQAEQAARGWSLVWTKFTTPPVAADALAEIAQLADVTAMAWGGYASAERCRVVIGREELMAGAAADPASLEGVAALDVRGNFMFDPATHRDFLGALVGTGVVRDRIGDILVQGEAGAQALVDADLAEHFEAELTKVRSVPVEVRRIPLAELRVPPPQVQEISSVEASMRLDAVASAGFRMGRGAMADLIKSGDVRVNWREAKKPSVELREGDVVSVAGRGRLEIRGVTTTKKEKFLVQMVRLL